MALDHKARFVSEMKNYVPVIKEAQAQGLSEADTKLRLTQFIKDVLAYDLFKDVSQEFGIKGRYADYAIRIDDEIKFLIEVKQISLRLKEKHLFQLANYAASEGVEWCLLTNSASFELYHVEYTKPVYWSLVFNTNLIDEDFEDTVEKLWYLTKRSMKRGEIDKYWHKQRSLHPVIIARAILSSESIRAIRKALRHITDLLIPEDELAVAIRDKVVREKIARDIGEIKVQKLAGGTSKRKTKLPRGKDEEQPPGQQTEETPRDSQGEGGQAGDENRPSHVSSEVEREPGSMGGTSATAFHEAEKPKNIGSDKDL